jgi:hypothetical protein
MSILCENGDTNMIRKMQTNNLFCNRLIENHILVETAIVNRVDMQCINKIWGRRINGRFLQAYNVANGLSLDGVHGMDNIEYISLIMTAILSCQGGSLKTLLNTNRKIYGERVNHWLKGALIFDAIYKIKRYTFEEKNVIIDILLEYYTITEIKGLISSCRDKMIAKYLNIHIDERYIKINTRLPNI